jgi:GNAT superfamily N-acetyltransferase
MTSWRVRPVRTDEFDAWAGLFAGYAAFYRVESSPEHKRQIWGWIHDERCIEALVAVPLAPDGSEAAEPAGLAHLRTWVRPLRGSVCGYLDDLYVDPSVRGQGAVSALFDEIRRLATERGWPVVRWTTAEDNYRARTVYDRVATRTTWITYDLTV